MRRILLALLCCLLLTTAVSAAGTVPEMQNTTTVASDGTCHVTVTFQFKLDAVPEKLVFPLPAQAKDISLNGGSARTSLSGALRNVNLRSAVSGPGIHTVTLQYSLPDAVTADDKEQLYLTVPLLSGFAYPIEKLNFTIHLPGPPEKRPSFVSTYHQESVESLMDYRAEENVISCAVNEELKDHESLTMTLWVSEELFPQPVTKKWSMGRDDVAMYAVAVLALLYWLAALRCLPCRRIRQSTPPAGLSAGAMGCALAGAGTDLTLLVLSWAQQGYLLIHRERGGRVLLHKRMEMGNERSSLENKLFRSLFGKRATVDGTGEHYARLCRNAARTVAGRKSYFRGRAGNVRVFRGIAAGVGFLGGICLATAFANDTIWQILLSILLCSLGTVCAWLVQEGAWGLLLRYRDRLFAGLAAAFLWTLLCAWAGEWVVAVFVVLTQSLAGLAAAYGGRRTELGRQTMKEILALRRYFKTVPRAELDRLLHLNPDYYYSVAPYALALGVDRAFAARFGKSRLRGCAYLTTGMDGHMTVREWNQLLRETAQALDARQKRLPLDRLMRR